MADSNIVCSGLTATGGIGQIVLGWQAADVTDFRNLVYMQLDRFEVWASATNDRNAATKVGEVINNGFPHTGLAQSTTRYYWVRARDRSGNFGDWFPLSATAGISGTTSIIVPPNSVGTTELENNAVTEAKIDDLAVSNAKIASLAVTEAKIANLAVSNAKIEDLAVNFAKIAALSVGTGKIQNLAVDTLKVGNLQITNGKIGSDAVSKSGWSYAAAQNAGSAILASVALTTQGGTVNIDVGCIAWTSGSGTPTANYALVVNGSNRVVHGHVLDDIPKSTVAMSFQLDLPAGTHTFALAVVAGDASVLSAGKFVRVSNISK